MENTVKLDGEAMIQWMMVRFNQTRQEAFASLPQELKESFNNTTGE
jgi:hypothetical protein|tara:strand:- start:441 stop:578 length:138 start_codon:yes stop_codon:yes gene_type:complete